MKIKFLDNTIGKYALVQSSEILDDGKKFNVKAGDSLDISWYKEIQNHYLVELVTPIKGRYNWYFWHPHSTITYDSPELTQKILDVPYYSQRDNAVRPYQTCNMTCAAMTIKYYYPDLKTGKEQLEDKLTKYATEKWGADSIYYHGRIAQVLDNWGVVSTFNTATPFREIKKSIDNGNPVIYSGNFTKSGHIIVIIGYDDTGFIVNDPYGEWTQSGYKNVPGDRLHYSYKLVGNLSYTTYNSGWAHLLHKKER
jgi:uncharacterized protein YvpB